MNIKKLTYFLPGLFLVAYGIDILKTGLIADASIRGGITVYAGEYQELAGWAMIILGCYLCYTVIKPTK